jgi:hypothetical protein
MVPLEGNLRHAAVVHTERTASGKGDAFELWLHLPTNPASPPPDVAELYR